jgi:hypothetical protein
VQLPCLALSVHAFFLFSFLCCVSCCLHSHSRMFHR